MTINILKSRTYGVQHEGDKIALLMTDHQALVSPIIQQKFRFAMLKIKEQKKVVWYAIISLCQSD